MNSLRFISICITLWCSSYVARIQCAERAYPGYQTDSIVNEKIAIEGHGVFLKDVYDEKTPTTRIGTVCETQLAPTLAWNKRMESYDIGYELFHGVGKTQLESWDYFRYRKVIDGEPDKNPRPIPHDDTVESIYNVDDTIIPIDNNLVKVSFKIKPYDEHPSTVDYYWIDVLTITVNPNQRKIFFTRDLINYYIHRTITIDTCTVYYLGNGKVANAQPSYQPVGDILQNTQIIPMRMFHTLASRLATCTYLNFAFMWKSVAEGILKHIDLFLYSLYRVFPEKLDITFGALGDLQVDPTERQRIAYENEQIREFPIPEKLYRLVEYDYTDEFFTDGTIFQTIIIIHNNPASGQEAGRICRVEEEIKGWDDIKNTNMPGLSYACPVTKQLAENLHVPRGVVLTDVLRPLNLKEFPTSRNRFSGRFRTGSVLSKVYKERDQLISDNNTT
ncbi:uncharacterized protein LOC135846798 [Planococcus citri]|uniref:uncharacterized protein LOC135846798 n=1 Tax=Planococcus citri TaxID=170843 RepID=UPI0031FA3171